ncbi:hypothetical protein OF83DRAFT_1179749 [Amylostereum chailletii]|nr:hypothetical protein OF83DRAFT_1179749 [Amylostereum chailletii]
MSSVPYNSVKELEDHINGILREAEKPGNVDLTAEVERLGLRLCVSDIVHANFIKDADGKIVAVDFAGYSFLPPSFFAFVLHHESTNFALRVASRLKYTQPELSQLEALRAASYALVPFGTNAFGLPKRR